MLQTWKDNTDKKTNKRWEYLNLQANKFDNLDERKIPPKIQFIIAIRRRKRKIWIVWHSLTKLNSWFKLKHTH